MSVVAWDGKWLAANTTSISSGLKTKTIKTRCVEKNGKTAIIYAWVGDISVGRMLAEWHEKSKRSQDFPSVDKDDGATLIIVSRHMCSQLSSHQPSMVPIDGAFESWGSGFQVAMGAMYMGASPMNAVRAANSLITTCGGGIEYYNLETMERFIDEQ